MSEESLHQAPELGDRVTDHISGLLTQGQNMVILLDVDRLIGPATQQIQDCAA